MIDSAWKTAVREGVNHISVLMHPFKDGRLDRLPLTKTSCEVPDGRPAIAGGAVEQFAIA